jgi:ribonuclease-3
VVEALVAALYLDQGRAAAEAFVRRELLCMIPEVQATLADNNPKGTLQQQVLKETGLLPRYEMLHEDGQCNDRRYTVGVFAGDDLLAQSQGSSIKEAGREAARAALRELTQNQLLERREHEKE